MQKVVAFTLPLSATSLINMISSFIAMRFVAQLGKSELAAAALAASTFLTIMTVVGTSFYAVGISVSHYRAQEKPATEIGELVKNSFWLAIMLAFPAGILLWNIDKVLLLFKENLQLVLLTQSYFHFAALSMLPILITNVIAQFYTGIGKPKFVLLTSLISFPLIVLCSYGFILGKLDLPQLGLAGVTCAAVCIQTLYCICMLIYMSFTKEFKKYQIFKRKIRPNWSLCKTILILGMPIGIQFGGELAAIAIATYLMGYFGVIALAASQLVSQYSMLVIMITLGLSQALSVLVSAAYGKQDLELIKQYIISSLLLFVMLWTLVFLIFLFCPVALIKFYINTNFVGGESLINLAVKLFALSAIMLLFDGIRNLLSGSLRGLHDSKAPMRIGILCLWIISLPLCYLIAFTYHGGPVGLRIGFISGFAVAVAILCIRVKDKLRTTTVYFENSVHNSKSLIS